MSSIQPKSTESVEVVGGPVIRPVEVRYMLIDSHGGSDEVQYKSYITLLETLLNDQGIGDELESLLWESDINPHPSCYDDNACEAVSSWFGNSENRKTVEGLMSKYGYRVNNVFKMKGEK